MAPPEVISPIEEADTCDMTKLVSLIDQGKVQEIYYHGSFYSLEDERELSDVLAENVQLRKLSIEADDDDMELVCELFFMGLSANKGLRELHIGMAFIMGDGLYHALQKNCTLETLSLTCCHFLSLEQQHNRDLEALNDITRALASNPSLTSFSIEFHLTRTMTADNAKGIATIFEVNTILKSFALRNFKVPEFAVDTIVKGLKKNKKLLTLELSGCMLSADSAARVVYASDECPTLKYLDLSRNNINKMSESLVRALSSNTTVHAMMFNENKITTNGTRLLEVLRENSTLKGLSLEEVGLKTGELEVVTCGLRQNFMLQYLNLSSNKLSKTSVAELSQALRSNCSLKELLLVSCKIADEGAEELAKSLACNTILLSLDLTANRIEARGAQSIFNAIKRNNSLKCLILSRNPKLLTDRTCSIAVMLKQNKCLEILHVEHTGMKDPVLERIAASLLVNKSLRELNLRFNAVRGVGVVKLGDAVARNTTMECLYVGKNSFSVPIAKQLVKIFRAHPTLSKIDVEALGGVDIYEVVHDARKEMKQKYHVKRQIFQKVLSNLKKVPWKRSKVIALGGSLSGKTATVRSLVNTAFDPCKKPTSGLVITETRHSQGNFHTEERFKSVGFVRQLCYREAAILYGLYRHRVGTKPRSSVELKAKRMGKRVSSRRLRRQTRLFSNTLKRAATQEVEVDDAADVALGMSHFKDSDFAEAERRKDDTWISVWDLSGKPIFSMLHQLFLTNYGVCLVVFNQAKLLKDTKGELNQLHFWLNSVQLYAPDAPVLLVGTSLEQLPDGAFTKQVEPLVQGVVNSFENLFPQEQSVLTDVFFPISNKHQLGVHQLKARLSAVTQKQSFDVSVQWLHCLDYLVTENGSDTVVKFTDLRAKAKKDFEIGTSELKEMLALFHQLGLVFYFTHTQGLQDYIVINPQWLLQSFTRVLSDQVDAPDAVQLHRCGLKKDAAALTENGFASYDLLQFFWGKAHVGFLLDLMQNLCLLSEWRFGSNSSEHGFLVPSMIKKKSFGYYSVRRKRNECIFDFRFLPSGIFERLICLCVGRSAQNGCEREPLLNKDFCKIFFDDDYSFTLYRNEHTIAVAVDKDKHAAAVMKEIVAMLHKIRKDVLGLHFKWKTSLKINGTSYAYTFAKKKSLHPWFSKEEQLNAMTQEIEQFIAEGL